MEKRIDAYMEYRPQDQVNIPALQSQLQTQQIERAVIVEPFGSPRWKQMAAAVAPYPEQLTLAARVSAAARASDFRAAVEHAAEKRQALVLDLGPKGFCPAMPIQLTALAEAFSQQVFVLAHMAYATPKVRTDPANRAIWDALIEVCHTHKNLRLDIAHFAQDFGEEEFPYESGQRLIEEAIGYIGNNKFLWGSALPAAKGLKTYTQALDVIEKDYHIPEKQKEGILYYNALACYFNREKKGC